MNKKLFFKLGFLLLSLSLVSCGQKNNSAGEDTSFKSSTSQFAKSAQSSLKESVKTISPSIENIVENKQEDADVQKDTQKNTQTNIQQDTHQGIQADTQDENQQVSNEESTEDKYFIIIKEAWQRQKDYINSIDDPKVKQSVQTTQSAAIMEATGLLMEYPEDSEAINASLKRVLNGE